MEAHEIVIDGLKYAIGVVGYFIGQRLERRKARKVVASQAADKVLERLDAVVASASEYYTTPFVEGDGQEASAASWILWSLDALRDDLKQIQAALERAGAARWSWLCLRKRPAECKNNLVVLARALKVKATGGTFMARGHILAANDPVLIAIRNAASDLRSCIQETKARCD